MTDFSINAVDLGRVEPAGLEYCRRNGLPTDYRRCDWTVADDTDTLDELLIVGTTVIWTSGGQLQRAFDFSEERQTVRQAVFARFPTSDASVGDQRQRSIPQLGVDTRAPSTIFALSNAFKSTANVVHNLNSNPRQFGVDRVLVVLLDELAHIYYPDGRRDVINLPFHVHRAFPCHVGLLLERTFDIDEFPRMEQQKLAAVPKFFFLPDPMDELGIVMSKPREVKSLGNTETVLFADGEFLVTVERSRRLVTIWHMFERGNGSQVASTSSSSRGNHVRRRSSMRTSVTNISKLENLDDDNKASTVRSDLTAHLDRIVFADADPSGAFTDATNLRCDRNVSPLESFTQSSETSAQEVFLLSLATGLVILCIFDGQENSLREVVYRRSSSGRPVLVQSRVSKCYGAAKVEFERQSYLIILDAEHNLCLQSYLSPKIYLRYADRCSALRKHRGAEFIVHHAQHKTPRRLSVGSATISGTLACYWRGLASVMPFHHFQIFLAIFLNVQRSYNGSEISAFAVALLACYLNPEIPCIPSIQANSMGSETIDTTMLDLVASAHHFCRLNDLSVMRKYLPQILLGLHFVTEELTLDSLKGCARIQVLPILAQITNWLRWDNYVEFYSASINSERAIALSDPLDHLVLPAPSDGPPSIVRWATSMMRGQMIPLQTIDLLIPPDKTESNPYHYNALADLPACPLTSKYGRILANLTDNTKNIHDVVSLMVELRFTRDAIDRLPQALATPIREVVRYCAINPPTEWSNEELVFVGRHDLIETLNSDSEATNTPINVVDVTRQSSTKTNERTDLGMLHSSKTDGKYDTEHDGLDGISSLLFPHDRRLLEVARLLTCHKTVTAHMSTNEHLGDAEQIREQQHLSRSVALRTLSVPIGRGLLYYNSKTPLLTEKFSIQKLNFDVKIKPAQITVSEDKTFLTPAVKVWCQFHNGVATGLSISKSSQEISASWIAYNKPEELTNGHAGFLLGLGLNGHLKSMATWHAFNYLTSKHAVTSIGLLLGLSASFLGTMDPMITKLLSVHILALLPSGSNELNLPGITQSAGLVGIGLLYYNTNHQRMSEVLLREITQPDNSADLFRDEGYRLTAGLALGIINVGSGGRNHGKSGSDVLKGLIESLDGVTREKHNLDVKMPGSIVALALVYLRTNSKYAADRLRLPNSRHALDSLRPDLYLLKMLALGLIMWDEISPTHDYVESLLPAVLRGRGQLDHIQGHHREDLILFNVVVGAALSVGMKFAGTHDKGATDFVLGYLDKFIAILNFEAHGFDQKCNVVAVKTLIGVLSFAASMIMAGTGDLGVLRRLRRIHYRLDSSTTYGHHLATELSIGLLFVGHGQYSLCRTDLALCSFVASFYPVLPMHTEDNRSHLQALRHLWVLGVERRCLVLRETETRLPCSTRVELSRYAASGVMTEYRISPCILPPMETISAIKLSSPGYWPAVLDFENNPNHRESFIVAQTMFVTKRNHDKLTTRTSELVSADSMAADSIAAQVAKFVTAISSPQHKSSTSVIKEFLEAQDSWPAYIFSARGQLLRAAESNTVQAYLEREFVLAYWRSTTRGFLSDKFSCLRERILSEEFIQQMQLQTWNAQSDNV